MFLTVLKNANLALAFFLELAVLAALGYWGFSTGQGTLARIGLGIGIPAVAVVVWALFGSPQAAWRLQGSWFLILRLFVLKQLFNWGLEQTEKQVCKNPLVQWFCLSRFVERAKPLVEGKMASAKEVCRSRVRSVRQVAQKLHRLVRRAEMGEKQQEQQAEQQRMLSQQLMSSAEQMVRQARQVTTSLLQQVEKSAQHLEEQVEPLLPLIERVIVQARTRVLEGKQVAASDKVLSLFEPHTRINPRHKGGAPVEFGRQVEQGAGRRRDCDTFPDFSASR
jgi:Protein of unknown function (DUF2568)